MILKVISGDTSFKYGKAVRYSGVCVNPVENDKLSILADWLVLTSHQLETGFAQMPPSFSDLYKERKNEENHKSR